MHWLIFNSDKLVSEMFIGIRETGHAPGSYVFDRVTSFRYFCRCSPYNHFYQIIFNSDKLVPEMFIGIRETGHAPGSYVF